MSGIGVEGVSGAVPGQRPDVVEDGAPKRTLRSQTAVSNGGFGLGTRDTLGGVTKEIPIPFLKQEGVAASSPPESGRQGT